MHLLIGQFDAAGHLCQQIQDFLEFGVCHPHDRQWQIAPYLLWTIAQVQPHRLSCPFLHTVKRILRAVQEAFKFGTLSFDD